VSHVYYSISDLREEGTILWEGGAVPPKIDDARESSFEEVTKMMSEGVPMHYFPSEFVVL